MKKVIMAAEEEAAKKAANEKKLQSMRNNLQKLENRANEILQHKESLTAAERRELLQILNISYHMTGKIQGIFSIDSWAGCAFCEKMRAAAENLILMICRYCYAAADSWKEAAWRRHKLNAIIFSNVLFTIEELQTLPLYAARMVRFNEDGDTVNQTMAQNYLRITRAFPAIRFGYFFKNAAAVEKGLHAEGIFTREQLPQNVRFIQSSVLIGFPAKPVWFADYVFTVFPDEKTTADAIAAGAWACNGRKCSDCGFHCYLSAERPAEPQNIAELLRCSKAMRAAVLQAYAAEKAKHAA